MTRISRSPWLMLLIIISLANISTHSAKGISLNFYTPLRDEISSNSKFNSKERKIRPLNLAVKCKRGHQNSLTLNHFDPSQQRVLAKNLKREEKVFHRSIRPTPFILSWVSAFKTLTQTLLTPSFKEDGLLRKVGTGWRINALTVPMMLKVKEEIAKLTSNFSAN